MVSFNRSRWQYLNFAEAKNSPKAVNSTTKKQYLDGAVGSDPEYEWFTTLNMSGQIVSQLVVTPKKMICNMIHWQG